MRIHRNHRSKFIYGLLLAMAVTTGFTGLRSAQSLGAKLTDATQVVAPALGDAALIERQVGTVQVRLDGFVTAAARHETQYVADQDKDLGGWTELLPSGL